MLLSIFTQLSELRKAEKFTKPLQGWELLEKMQISTAVKRIFRENKKVHWKKNFGYKKKKKKHRFSYAPNTCAHSERAHAWLSLVSVAVIVNTVAGCYFRGQSLAPNTVTPT